MAKACKSNMSKEFKLKSALRAYADGGTVMTAATALRDRSKQIDAAVEGKTAPRREAPPKQEAPKQPERVKPHPDYKPRGLLRNILGFETGGEVDGPGGPTEDKVPIMASDGEYVLPAKTVQALGGPENLDKLVLRTNGREPGPKMVDGMPHAALGAYVDKAKDLAAAGAEKVTNYLRSPQVQSNVGAAMNTAKEVATPAVDAVKSAAGQAAGAVQGVAERAPGLRPPTSGIEVGQATMNDFRNAKVNAPGVAPEYSEAVKRAEVARRLNPTAMPASGGAAPPTAGGAAPTGRGYNYGRGVGSALRHPLAKGAMGRVGGVAAVIPEAMDDRQVAFLDDPNVSLTDKARQLGRAGLRVAGGIVGGAGGAAAGSIVPVAGTVAGAVTGGYAGTQGGDWLGEKLLGDPMAGYQGGGAGPNPQREIKERFLPPAGATAGTDRMVNNVPGLRALDNAQLTPQPDVIEQPAGPAGTGINRIDGVPGLRSPLYTNVPREQAIADVQGGTVSSVDMRGNLRAMAAENAIRQSSIDAQDRRDAEEAAAARQRYIGYMESSAVPETDRFGKTAAERDLEMAEFRSRGSDPKQRAAELAGAKEGVENERKTSVLRQEAANRMRTDDTNRLESENILRANNERTDAMRVRNEIEAQNARARAQSEAAKAAAEERKRLGERDDKVTGAVRTEVYAMAGISQGSSPEERAKANKVIDRVLNTARQNGISPDDLDGATRNELYRMAAQADAVDEDNQTWTNRVMQFIGARKKAGTSRDLLQYDPTGLDGGLTDDDVMSGVGPQSARLRRQGNTDWFTSALPDVEETSLQDRLRRAGRQ